MWRSTPEDDDDSEARVSAHDQRHGRMTMRWCPHTREWIPKTREERYQDAIREQSAPTQETKARPRGFDPGLAREIIESREQAEEESREWQRAQLGLAPPLPPEPRGGRFAWQGGPRPPWWQRQPEAYQQPYETEQEYEARMDRFMDLVARVDIARGWPRAVELMRYLSGPHDLDLKKKAAEAWYWWARDFCAPKPPSLIHGRMVILWSGCSIGSLPSCQALHRSEAWLGYQKELADRREARRSPRGPREDLRDRRLEKRIFRAERQLEKLLSEITVTEDPKKLGRLIAQAKKRIEILPPSKALRYQALIQ